LEIENFSKDLFEDIDTNNNDTIDILDCLADPLDEEEAGSPPGEDAASVSARALILGCSDLPAPRRQLLLALLSCRCGAVCGGLEERAAHAGCSPAGLACPAPRCGALLPGLEPLQQHLTRTHRVSAASLVRKAFPDRRDGAAHTPLDLEQDLEQAKEQVQEQHPGSPKEAGSGGARGRAQCDLCGKEFRNKVSLQCSAGLFMSAVQCSAVQCSAVQCSAVQCSAVQYSAVQCSAVQYSVVQCR
jgi:hypothetical protein